MDEKNYFAANLSQAEIPTASLRHNQNRSGVTGFLGRQETM